MRRWAAFASVTASIAAMIAVTGVASGQPAAAARTIEVSAGEYKFQPDLIEATEGERIVLLARTTDGKKHGLSIKELGVKAEIPKTGDPVAIEFVAGKPGTYTIACSVYCGNGHSRMKARLVVSARK